MARFPWHELPLELKQQIISDLLTTSIDEVLAVFSGVTVSDSNGIRTATKVFVSDFKTIQRTFPCAELLFPILEARQRIAQRYDNIPKPETLFKPEPTTKTEPALRIIYEPYFLNGLLIDLEKAIARLEKKAPKGMDPELLRECQETKAAAKERKQPWGSWGLKVAYHFVPHVLGRTRRRLH